MEWFVIFNYSFYLSALVICCIVLVLTLLIGNIGKKVFRWFFIMICFSIIGNICDLFSGYTVWVADDPSSLVVPIAEYLSYSTGAIGLAAYGFYLYEYLSQKTRVSKTPFLFAAFIGSSVFIAVTLGLIFGNFFQPVVVQEYDFKETPFWMIQLIYALTLIACAITLSRHSKDLETREMTPLLFYLLTPAIATIIQLVVVEIWVAPFGNSIALFVILVALQMDLKRRTETQEEELKESRIAIMLSQIKPHFLYNVLGTIDNLCHDNPRAHEAIISFSEYLRGNLDSLSQKDPIPFVDEMKHVSRYLELEKLRFEERLDYSFVTPVTNFTVPTLSVQPLVENAVRYGITKMRDGGTVTISTDETDTHYRIHIDDDGIGFDVDTIALDNARSHMGIQNVRSRLEALSKGSLTIESTPGIGTKALIEIPKQH